MKEQVRGSGVLMHVSSLWGDYSCGSFGDEARSFVDFLKESGFTYWQTLPFCLPDGVGSPYSSFGAFSVNPNFIDLEERFIVGLISREELDGARQKQPYTVEFGRLRAERMALLSKAAERFRGGGDFEEFFAAHPQSENFCRFMAIKKANGEKPFWEWTANEPDEETLRTWRFVCYTFMRQWKALKSYASAAGVRVIGDVPIYVSFDSADVWANKDLFQLDERLRPTRVAGVPPDYFCPDGQLWGNPLYDWAKMEQTGFAWWKERMSFMYELFDCVRIDHFRGIDAYYAIPFGAPNARKGKWIKGPGMKLVKALKEAAAGRPLIAEDLGVYTPSLEKLMKDSGLPGMHVLQFGFPVGAGGASHLPHNYPANCVAYTGTHDNNTLLGAVWDMDEQTRCELLNYCGYPYNGGSWDRREAYDAVIRTLLASPADRAIVPLQDLLGFGADTRMTTPGVPEGNWGWRATRDQLSRIDIGKWAYFNRLYERLPFEEEEEKEAD